LYDDSNDQTPDYGIITNISMVKDNNVIKCKLVINIDQSNKIFKRYSKLHSMIVLDEVDSVLAIPIQFLNFNGNQPYCYVLEGGKIQKENLYLGIDDGKFVEVKSGLSHGDVVIYPE
jgi:HlyD family secretion protein